MQTPDPTLLKTVASDHNLMPTVKSLNTLRFQRLACWAGVSLLLGTAPLRAQPVITNQPASQTALVGATVTFSVGVTGAPPLSYQWVFNILGNRLPGATNDTLILPNVQASNAGNYRVTISNDLGSVLSGSGRLTVVTPPVITPANPTASLFADVTLLATNVAAGAISFQWLFNGEPMADAETNKLVVANVQKTNAGNYATVITYAFGSVTSQVATLKITSFNSMYGFGFSWTDTRNSNLQPPQYYMRRACNGPMWPEFVSTNLGLAYAETNNYAVGNSAATSTWALNQVNTFPTPSKPELSAYFVWLATDDITAVMVTNQLAWDTAVQAVMLNYSNTIHRLYARGARQIVVEGTTDLSAHPTTFPEASLFGTDAAGLARYSSYLARFNGAMFDAVEANRRAKPDLRVIPVDAFSKLNEIVRDPTRFGFTKSTVGALDDPDLVDKSFTGPGSNYVFWDGHHGTSRLNEQVAAWHMEALTNAVLERLEAIIANSSATVAMNHLLIGRDYTLQRSADLERWEDVQTFTATAGTNQVSQALETVTASVFYRLQWQP